MASFTIIAPVFLVEADLAYNVFLWVCPRQLPPPTREINLREAEELCWEWLAQIRGGLRFQAVSRSLRQRLAQSGFRIIQARRLHAQLLRHQGLVHDVHAELPALVGAPLASTGLVQVTWNYHYHASDSSDFEGVTPSPAGRMVSAGHRIPTITIQTPPTAGGLEIASCEPHR